MGNPLGDKTPDLNKDDVQARRILSLAIFLTNRNVPTSTDEVAGRFYPDISAASADRTFRRDREHLAACGLVVRSCEMKDGSRGWRVDPDSSYASPRGLSPVDAATIAIACRPLVSDPSFVFHDELRMALAKIDRSFSDRPVVSGPRDASATSRTVGALARAFVRRHPVDVTYRDSKGSTSERRLCVYGFFGLRGRTYAVALRTDGDEHTVHSYRVDRFLGVTPKPSMTYDIPEDFFVEDHIGLPFQLGHVVGTARFEVDRATEATLRRTVGTAGSWEHEADSLVWSVEMSDVDAAASWAVAQAIRPIGPPALVERWTSCLEGVIAHV